MVRNLKKYIAIGAGLAAFGLASVANAGGVYNAKKDDVVLSTKTGGVYFTGSTPATFKIDGVRSTNSELLSKIFDLDYTTEKPGRVVGPRLGKTSLVLEALRNNPYFGIVKDLIGDGSMYGVDSEKLAKLDFNDDDYVSANEIAKGVGASLKDSNVMSYNVGSAMETIRRSLTSEGNGGLENSISSSLDNSISGNTSTTTVTNTNIGDAVQL